MNIIIDKDNAQVEVRCIVESDSKVWIVCHVHNHSKQDSEIRTDNDRSSYRSKKYGVKSFSHTYPFSSYHSYSVPAGFFLELQFAYNCPKIEEDDEFDFEIGYSKFLFKYSDGKWSATKFAKKEGEKNQTYELNFKNTTSENSGDTAISHPYELLSSLIGIQSVKDEITTLSNFVKIQNIRKSRGLQSTNVSYHCVFTGNPGTGKTTVARIVASIYKELGILKKGHLIETDRSGLVAEYVGQTAQKTNKVVDSALDGVLFIDEAYSLAAYDGKNDFGSEAIATLLKRMEDDRDRLVVIVAGYSKEMTEFINSNSGLKSRFIRFIEFPDYTTTELSDIFMKFVHDGDFCLEEGTLTMLNQYFDKAISLNDPNYGNGRFARNLFEETLKVQANRLADEQNLSDDDLQLILKQDLITAANKFEL